MFILNTIFSLRLSVRQCLAIKWNSNSEFEYLWKYIQSYSQIFFKFLIVNITFNVSNGRWEILKAFVNMNEANVNIYKIKWINEALICGKLNIVASYLIHRKYIIYSTCWRNEYTYIYFYPNKVLNSSVHFVYTVTQCNT